jgi:hypothetical protein
MIAPQSSGDRRRAESRTGAFENQSVVTLDGQPHTDVQISIDGRPQNNAGGFAQLRLQPC